MFDDHLFLSASYRIGARYLKLTAAAPETVWASDDRMSSQYTTCVQRDGFLYGVHGREDVGQPELRCLAAATGEIQWTQPYDVAHLILAGDRLLIQSVTGRLVLAEANPRGFRAVAMSQLDAQACSARCRRWPTAGCTFAAATATTGGLFVCRWAPRRYITKPKRHITNASPAPNLKKSRTSRTHCWLGLSSLAGVICS